MFDELNFDNMDMEQQSELKQFDPNYLMGIAAVDKETGDKVFFYMDANARFNAAMVNKETGDSMKHGFSLVEACKLVYILQFMIAEFIDFVTAKEEEEESN